MDNKTTAEPLPIPQNPLDKDLNLAISRLNEASNNFVKEISFLGVQTIEPSGKITEEKVPVPFTSTNAAINFNDLDYLNYVEDLRLGLNRNAVKLSQLLCYDRNYRKRTGRDYFTPMFTEKMYFLYECFTKMAHTLNKVSK